MAIKKVFVAGHKGMVGSAILRNLDHENSNRDIIVASKKELDLANQNDVNNFISLNKPDEIIIAAAKVGGIHANTSYPAEFIHQNLNIALNLIHAAYENKTKKLLYLGSSCIYPRDSKQPITEDQLLNGQLEKTNEWYAIAKIAGIKLCQAYRKQYGCNFISAMPTNLYGDQDNYHLENAHVIPALMHRAYLAKQKKESTLQVWGSGNATREFLYVNDLAEACILLLDDFSDPLPINIGTGVEISIKDLAKLICKTVGFQGDLIFDSSKPDGTPRKVLDVSKLNNLGWKSKTNLEDGLKKSYSWFVNNFDQTRK